MARPKGIPFTEENSSANYAEFAISRKPDGKIKTLRLLFVFMYLVFAVAYCVLFLVVVKMGPMIAMLPLLVLIMWLLTWRITKVEFMYIVYQGQLHIYCYNGYNKAKEVFTAKISENEGVYPVSDEAYTKYASSCEAELDYSIGKNTEDRYFAIFDVNGKKTAVYFTASAKLLTGLRYYGGENVVVTYVSR